MNGRTGGRAAAQPSDEELGTCRCNVMSISRLGASGFRWSRDSSNFPRL